MPPVIFVCRHSPSALVHKMNNNKPLLNIALWRLYVQFWTRKIYHYYIFQLYHCIPFPYKPFCHLIILNCGINSLVLSGMCLIFTDYALKIDIVCKYKCNFQKLWKILKLSKNEYVGEQMIFFHETCTYVFKKMKEFARSLSRYSYVLYEKVLLPCHIHLLTSTQ